MTMVVGGQQVRQTSLLATHQRFALLGGAVGLRLLARAMAHCFRESGGRGFTGRRSGARLHQLSPSCAMIGPVKTYGHRAGGCCAGGVDTQE